MTKPTEKEALKKSRLYQQIVTLTRLTDTYQLDAILGLIPGGIGDFVAAFFALAHIFFGAFKLRSIPLTLALLNNMLCDVLLGLLPFYIGNVIDFLYRSNQKNMILIHGFLNDDPFIMHQVNTKARQAAITLVVLVLLIALMIALLAWLVAKIGSLLFA